MKTLGIEMVDAGFEVAVGRSAPGGGGRPTAERLVPPGTVPAMVLQGEGELHFGAEAEARRFLFPRQMCDTFWDDLSLEPSTLRQGGRQLSQSELSFHFLRHLVDGLSGVASQHESLALAVPSAFLEGPRAEERVGLLLGMSRDLELRLASVVDLSCAALLDPESAPLARGTALVVDLGLHAANFSIIDLDGAATRRTFARIPGAGWMALSELARRSLADRFLRQTSFDVSADRRTEQEFHVQSLAALGSFTTQSEAWLRIVSASRERVISVPRDGLAADLKPLAETIAQNARELLARFGQDFSGVQVVLTARARHLCGLATAMRTRGAISVTVLSPGAAARGAAVLACEREVPAELEDVPVETSVVLPAEATDQASALRAAFTFHRHGGRRETGPTHVVFDGYAHALRATGLRVGTGGDSRASDLAVSVAPAGVGSCEIVIEPIEGRWRASALLRGQRVEIPGGEAPLAPGDALEIHGSPGAARLLFVRVPA